MKTRWKRARRPEQIAERREAILASARYLFENGGLETSRLSSIAKRAGLSKANIYRYFESRESILLAVLIEEMEKWSCEISDALEEISGADCVKTVSEAFGRTAAAHPQFCQLFSTLAPVLYQKLSIETISEFKSGMLEQIERIVCSLDGVLPNFGNEKSKMFINFHLLYLAGVWPHSDPTENVQEVIKDEKFAIFRIEFEPLITEQVRITLIGLMTQA